MAAPPRAANALGARRPWIQEEGETGGIATAEGWSARAVGEGEATLPSVDGAAEVAIPRGFEAPAGAAPGSASRPSPGLSTTTIATNAVRIHPFRIP